MKGFQIDARRREDGSVYLSSPDLPGLQWRRSGVGFTLNLGMMMSLAIVAAAVKAAILEFEHWLPEFEGDWRFIKAHRRMR